MSPARSGYVKPWEVDWNESHDNDGMVSTGIGFDLLIPFALFVLFNLLALVLMTWSTRRRNPVPVQNQEALDIVAVRQALQVRRQRPAAAGGDDDSCPICLDHLSYTIGTNCSHIFCAPCLLAVWSQGVHGTQLPCPCCRRQVTLMLEDFTEQEKTSEEGGRLLLQLTRFNKHFESRSMWETIRDVPALLSYLVAHRGLLGLVRLREVLIGLTFLLYLLSPFDLIPEAVFGVVGLIDDLFALALFLLFTAFVVREIVRNRR